MPTRRKLKSKLLEQGPICSLVWHDRRTGTVLAPGAVQNWPTRAEEEAMDAENAHLREIARQEYLRLLKQSEKG